MMADAIGAKLDKMTFDVTFTAATGDTDLGFMQIPKGTVAGVYGYHRGWVGDKNVVSVGFNWTMGEHVTPPKPLEHGHVIQVFGLPNMRTVLHCLPPKDWTEPGFMGLGMIYTAMPVTNAVPAVVAAPPGIVTLGKPASRYPRGMVNELTASARCSGSLAGPPPEREVASTGPMSEPGLLRGSWAFLSGLQTVSPSRASGGLDGRRSGRRWVDMMDGRWREQRRSPTITDDLVDHRRDASIVDGIHPDWAGPAGRLELPER